jgi:hypothetical protein
MGAAVLRRIKLQVEGLNLDGLLRHHDRVYATSKRRMAGSMSNHSGNPKPMPPAKGLALAEITP